MTRKICFIMYCLISVAGSTAYAFELEGTVYSPDGTPLEGASIRLVTSQRAEVGKDYTNSKGVYQIHEVPQGDYSLEVTKSGFSRYSEEITISGFLFSQRIYKDIYMIEYKSGAVLTRADLNEMYLPLDYKIPPKALRHYFKGLKYLENEIPRKAIKFFTKSINDDPTFSRAFMQLGIAHLQLKEFDTAMSNFRIASEKNSKDPLPIMNMGIAYIQMEKFDTAESEFRKALQIDPSLSRCRVLLGQIYYSQQKWDLVINELSQANIKQQKPDSAARILLGNAYLKLNRLAEARDQYRAFLRENPYHENTDEVKSKIRKIEESLIIKDEE
jgi:tetratricopeptide (TPR) repeat protein